MDAGIISLVKILVNANASNTDLTCLYDILKKANYPAECGVIMALNDIDYIENKEAILSVLNAYIFEAGKTISV